jgi:hypothetical protein
MNRKFDPAQSAFISVHQRLALPMLRRADRRAAESMNRKSRPLIAQINADKTD